VRDSPTPASSGVAPTFLELRPADGRFDAVLSNATLHHLPDTRGALEHLRSLVEPGGVLGIVTFVRPRVRDLRRIANEVLPGSTAKRLLYGRVLLKWQRGPCHAA